MEGKIAIELPTVIWILPEEVAGGKLELSATLPVCWKKIYADATVAGPLGGIYPNVAAFCLFALAIRIKLRT